LTFVVFFSGNVLNVIAKKRVTKFIFGSKKKERIRTSRTIVSVVKLGFTHQQCFSGIIGDVNGYLLSW
jgi:hypothetical protein